MIEDMQLAGYAARTQEAYVVAVRQVFDRSALPLNSERQGLSRGCGLRDFKGGALAGFLGFVLQHI
jgi:hypothetical protein